MGKGVGKLIVAAIIYAAFTLYLYQPLLSGFERLDYLLLVNAPLAGCGCYVLSRRWMGSFWASFLAGALYGFGPFLLGLGRYHVAAGLLAAAVPWLFVPAARCGRTRLRALQVPLSLLPFLAVVLFFRIALWMRFFPVPRQAGLTLSHLVGLAVPLVMVGRDMTAIGFYHVPVAALVMGLLMVIKARRFGVVVTMTLGAALAFCRPLAGVSPVIWWCIPALCCSIIIGAGIGALSSAGYADRKYVAVSAASTASLTVASLLLATRYFQYFASLADAYAKLFLRSGKMYLLGTLAVIIIFFLVKARLRAHGLRLLVLCVAVMIDIFFGATCVVDKIT